MLLANQFLGSAIGDALDYYVHRGTRIPLTPASQRISVRFDPLENARQILEQVLSMKGLSDNRSILQSPTAPFLVLNRLPGTDPLLGTLLQFEPFRPGPAVFETSDGSLFIPDGSVDADFSGRTVEEIHSLLETAGGAVEKDPSSPFPFHVLRPRDGDAFRLANTLAEQLHVEAQPRFVKLLKTLPPPHSGWPLFRACPRGGRRSSPGSHPWRSSRCPTPGN